MKQKRHLKIIINLITNKQNPKSMNMGFLGGVGLETRYFNYGVSIGYTTVINFEGLKFSLNYWF